MERKVRIRLSQALVSVLAAAVIGLAGCGSNPTGTESVDDGLSSGTLSGTTSATTSDSLYTAPSAQNNVTNSETASPDPTATISPSPAATVAPTPTPTVAPTPAPTPVALPPEYALTADLLGSTSSGFLIWQRLTASVEVVNPSFLFSQTGTLIVRFIKDGEVVETLQQYVSLNPAEIKDYEFKSSVKADEATLSIATN